MISQLGTLLSELTSIPAVSGREARLAAWIESYFHQCGLEVSHDPLGNVVATLPGSGPPGASRPKLMIAAHMDEIGLVVKSIDSSGALRVAAVGGVNRRNLPAQQVVVHGREELPGIIGTIPPHLTSAKERKEMAEIDDLFIDVGLTFERVSSLVRPGDPVSFKPEGRALLDDRFASKSLDNRAGLAATLMLASRLTQTVDPKPAVDLLFAATSQEEVGLRGATAAAYRYAPDVAIAVDVGFGEMPGLEKRESITLGEGPAISTGPNIHPGMQALLQETALAVEIPHQIEVLPGSSGTDGWVIQVARSGVPTAIVSIPLRYMHSTVEVVALEDLAATVDLMDGFCRRISVENVKGWHGGSVPVPTE